MRICLIALIRSGIVVISALILCSGSLWNGIEFVYRASIWGHRYGPWAPRVPELMDQALGLYVLGQVCLHAVDWAIFLGIIFTYLVIAHSRLRGHPRWARELSRIRNGLFPYVIAMCAGGSASMIGTWWLMWWFHCPFHWMLFLEGLLRGGFFVICCTLAVVFTALFKLWRYFRMTYGARECSA